MSTPNYYLRASEISRPALLELGIAHYDGECRWVMEEYYPWLLNSFYLGNAVKYLWRCGGKGDLLSDLKKCENYLRWASPAARASGTGDSVRRCLEVVENLIVDIGVE